MVWAEICLTGRTSLGFIDMTLKVGAANYQRHVLGIFRSWRAWRPIIVFQFPADSDSQRIHTSSGQLRNTSQNRRSKYAGKWYLAFKLLWLKSLGMIRVVDSRAKILQSKTRFGNLLLNCIDTCLWWDLCGSAYDHRPLVAIPSSKVCWNQRDNVAYLLYLFC